MRENIILQYLLIYILFPEGLSNRYYFHIVEDENY